MPNKFYGDKTLFTSYKTPPSIFFVTSAKLIIFNVINFFIKLPLTDLDALS